MKKLLTSCFIVLLLPHLLADAQEPPEPFGIKMGQTTNGLNLKPTSKPGIFEVVPSVPNQMFSNYTVSVTPKSGRVTEVFGRFRREDRDVIGQLLAKKYASNPYGGLRAGNCDINILDDYQSRYGAFDCVVRFRDERLVSLGNAEQRQLDTESLDTERRSTEPVEGAFGIVLGQSSAGLQLGKVVNVDRGAVSYAITPPKSDDRFTNYLVELTPISKRVLAIFATYLKRDEDAVWQELLKKHGKRNADSYCITTGEKPPSERGIGDKFRSVQLFRSRRPGDDEKGQICYLDHGKEILSEFDQFEQEQQNRLLNKADKKGL